MSGLLAQFTVLLLAATPVSIPDVWGYTDTIRSKLGISHSVRALIIQDESFGPPTAYAWVPGGEANFFWIRGSTLKTSQPMVVYVITHELCHIKYGHSTFNVKQSKDVREVEADNCVKKHAGPKIWAVFEDAIREAGRQRIRARVLSSR